MSAASGWCQYAGSSSVNASATVPQFRHCCEPESCVGGQAAYCDGSVATVGYDDCSIRTISWDNLDKVRLTDGTWATTVALLALLLLLAFLVGLVVGIRRSAKKFFERIVMPTTTPLNT